MAEEQLNSFWGGWRERIRALRNIPPLLKIIWQSGPKVIAGDLVFRVLAALIPLSMLAVSKQILDAIQARFNGQPLPAEFWYFVAAEFGLAAAGGVFGRVIGYFDA